MIADVYSAGDFCVQMCKTVLYILTLGYHLPNHWSFHRSQVVGILGCSPGSDSGQLMCYFCGQRRNAAELSLSASVFLTDHYSVNAQPLSSEAGTV